MRKKIVNLMLNMAYAIAVKGGEERMVSKRIVVIMVTLIMAEKMLFKDVFPHLKEATREALIEADGAKFITEE